MCLYVLPRTNVTGQASSCPDNSVGPLPTAPPDAKTQKLSTAVSVDTDPTAGVGPSTTSAILRPRRLGKKVT